MPGRADVSQQIDLRGAATGDASMRICQTGEIDEAARFHDGHGGGASRRDEAGRHASSAGTRRPRARELRDVVLMAHATPPPAPATYSVSQIDDIAPLSVMTREKFTSGQR